MSVCLKRLYNIMQSAHALRVMIMSTITHCYCILYIYIYIYRIIFESSLFLTVLSACEGCRQYTLESYNLCYH